MKYGIGSLVRFNAPNGSAAGRVVGVRDDIDTYYVRWAFGLDVYGERITSGTSSCKEHQLAKITRKEYQRVRDGKAFGR